MNHVSPIRTTCLAVVVAWLPAAGATVESATAAPAAVVTDGLSPEVGDVVDWALDLFAQADLELPPLEIRHHGDLTVRCDGHRGIHRTGGLRNVVELCVDGAGPGTEAVVLHELAHAWVDQNVDEDRRDAFQAVRGFEHWRNYDTAPWYENGTEQAAEIIAWGLFDRPRAVVRIHDNSCDDLVLGYRTLTGRQPLHGFRDLCPP